MQLLYSFTPLVITILILLIKKFDFKKIVNGVFLGIAVLLLVTIMDGITNSVFHMSQTMYRTNIILGIIAGALPEELAKFIVMKLSKDKNKYNIFVYMVLIALTFAGIENYLFFNDAGVYSGITRLLSPGHLAFSFAMSFFLIKATKSKLSPLYNVLALIVPIILHQLFNTLIETYEVAIYVLGVITYILLIIKLFRVKNEESKVKLFIPKLIFATLVLLFFLKIGKFTPVTMNTFSEIDENVTMKVVETSEGHSFFGDEIIVKVEINNETDELYNIYSTNFMGINGKNGEIIYVSHLSDYEVESNSKKEIIFYFDKKENKQKISYIRYKRPVKKINEQVYSIMFEVK